MKATLCDFCRGQVEAEWWTLIVPQQATETSLGYGFTTLEKRFEFCDKPCLINWLEK